MTAPLHHSNTPVQLEFGGPAREDNADVQWFVAFLLAEPDWITAAEILRRIGQGQTDKSERWLRKLSERANGEVCGGPKGYRHIQRLTDAEFAHWKLYWGAQRDSLTNRLHRAEHARAGLILTEANEGNKGPA